MQTAIIIGATSGIGRELAVRPGFVATEILGPEHHYPLVMPVGKAAEHILKGLRRRRRVIIFDWKFRLITACWHLIPRALWERITFIRTR